MALYIPAGQIARETLNNAELVKVNSLVIYGIGIRCLEILRTNYVVLQEFVIRGI